MEITEATPTTPGVAKVLQRDATDTIPDSARKSTISDPRTDDRKVGTASEEGFAAKEGTLCFNCGKRGHWAKDCKQRRSYQDRNTSRNTRNTPDRRGRPNQSSQAGQPVTFKGTLYREAVRRMSGMRSNVKQLSKRSFFAGNTEDSAHDDNTVELSPDSGDDSDTVDQQLSQLFDTPSEEARASEGR
ncbi:uncharacterized protein GGS25DRAFT_530978 [Hypoxylon fragiforme]|uniref:uncharacterized protein n=1 Tax=Hypoxylon fragiforme TaxID=63214 RepID=UPI0020C73AD3|nr:uncharacterized protein GGS25DRAFT_530978 [Hypoxylon fragiforme]KAI2610025.1 hypothetical protein GGS25DRAFT_530978 [Hypoxylon fragiforme]